MHYCPGLHILSEFKSSSSDALLSPKYFREVIDGLIEAHNLQKVGEVYHEFEGGGFTAVICLTESHISIHTWPEYELATFDVFLSNFRQENDEKVRAIYQSVMDFYGAAELQKNELKR
jgi:S-adenosylmethionine decarboxylase